MALSPAVPAGKVAIAPSPLVTRITSVGAAASSPSATAQSPAATASSLPAGQQKVQIVKTADGKIQVLVLFVQT